jgi:hypothetical protein
MDELCACKKGLQTATLTLLTALTTQGLLLSAAALIGLFLF